MVDIAQLAVKVDTTDLKRGGAELDNLAKKGDRAEKEIKQLGAAAKTSGGNVRQLGSAAGQASNRMGAMRGNVQNVAFQVGDFATQVGAGTSAAQALGQQLPQLLGGFGVLGAVAGAAVAVLVPLAASFIDLGDDAEDLGEAIDTLGESLADLQSYVRLIDKLGEGFTRVDAAVLSLKRNATQLDLGAAVSQAIDPAIIDGFWETFWAGAKTSILFTPETFLESVGLDGLQYGEFFFRDFQSAIERLDFDQANLQAAILLDEIENIYGALTLAPPEVQQLFSDMVNVTAEGRNVVAEAERAEKILRLGGEAAADLADEIGEAAVQALNLAGVDIAAGIDAAAASAAVLATNLNIAYGEAVKIRQEQAIAQFNAKRYSGRGSYGMPGEEGAPGTFIPDEKLYNDWLKGQRGGGGGRKRRGGGGGRSRVDKEQLALEREAARVFADTRTEAEKYSIELEKLNNLKAKGAIDADTYTRALDNISQKYLNIGGAAEFWQDQMKSLQDGIVDAIVEGDNLAEVFGNLAKEIAKAAFQAALFNQGPFAQQGGGGGLLGGLFNGMFGGLSKLASFDGGGYTGDGSRVGGVDGKGGKLSILHPNETVLDHTKGSGMSTSPVNNIIVYDMREVGNYMSTPEGESKIVEVMRRNGWQAA